MTEHALITRPACLVTRPQHQSKALLAMLDQAGWNSILFPSIEIEAAPATPMLQQLAQQLQHYDFALFVSRN
ncbi:MAG: hypothetical protein Q9M29_10400, partial [Mariprofundaceae bacterium]|nr:hypothetical protein [Mariprofundaceae bacterium]